MAENFSGTPEHLLSSIAVSNLVRYKILVLGNREQGTGKNLDIPQLLEKGWLYMRRKPQNPTLRYSLFP
mgnify:CR=1 FL=1